MAPAMSSARPANLPVALLITTRGPDMSSCVQESVQDSVVAANKVAASQFCQLTQFQGPCPSLQADTGLWNCVMQFD